MYLFQCDYLEGCHPAIMQKLMETNLEQTPGYGEDKYCDEAKALIKQAFSCPDADVHFLVGGTQTNTTVIASILAPYEGALCCDLGHINCHETGAIESSGHKVLTVPNVDGRITAEQVEAAVAEQADDEHVVRPGMVYISMSTEIGTLYSLEQLKALYATCKRLGLPLYIDGARLGYALMSDECDVTAADLAANCDVFSIGGTKVGALFGEAVVFTNPALSKRFRYMIKQRGGMLAKGRLLGVQFGMLMQNNLYFDIAKKADDQAKVIANALKAKGIPMLFESPTNQQFPVLSNAQLAQLSADFNFATWAKVDADHTCVRICTSWATTDAQMDALLSAIKAL